jgi:hypothetical protein
VPGTGSQPAEFVAAIDSYEDREPGLGSDFAVEVHSATENIVNGAVFRTPYVVQTLTEAGMRCYRECILEGYGSAI